MPWISLVILLGLSRAPDVASCPRIDPNLSMAQLVSDGDGECWMDTRDAEVYWTSFWFTKPNEPAFPDHPSHLTPERVDGSIQPN